jgi:hypothetical protein
MLAFYMVPGRTLEQAAKARPVVASFFAPVIRAAIASTRMLPSQNRSRRELTRLAISVAAHEKRTREPIEQIDVAGLIAIGNRDALIESADGE